MNELKIYNSLNKTKEIFKPLNPPFVGLYVCGPTVYGEPHLGHARSAITFDVVFRYLKAKNYKVRYVRNITDVGHLVNDADEGEDKIAQKAETERLEPMEVAQLYTNAYHEALNLLNCLPPSIEPLASGHIPEQIEMIQKLIKNELAYEVGGSVYFDITKYQQKYHYGILSGRKMDELEAGAGNEKRNLEGQQEKKNSNDFALWKRANPKHIMQWNSPWGKGFPGWHIECSTMSSKYLGTHFDIHGGGIDLLFPHHECEIAQSVGANGYNPVKVWMHNNMITINGQKMGKSLGNAVMLNEFFSGQHPLLEKSYSPMTIRFFILQAHYRSTLDFSNAALQAAEKGLKKLMDCVQLLDEMKYVKAEISPDMLLNQEIIMLCARCEESMNDDFNTAIVLASLFELGSKINALHHKTLNLSTLLPETFDKLKTTFHFYIFDILGLKNERIQQDITEKLMQLIIEIRKDARNNKDYSTTDKIREALKESGIQLKDGKTVTEWQFD